MSGYAANDLRPCAFLSHASEDKDLARRIAQDLQQSGIDTFFDGWEIGPGDSLRQKIDLGLRRCTHFIVLLTNYSVDKRWVNAEIDAAFIKKVSGSCKLIPLRYQLPASSLSPLLSTLYAPSLDNYDEDVKNLISAIHGMSQKPPIGELPFVVQEAAGLGLSPAAYAIVKLVVDRSEHGDAFDPQLTGEELRRAARLNDDDIVDGVDELVAEGFVRKHVTMGCGVLGFRQITPESSLFIAFDKQFKGWDPEADALQIAADLVNGVSNGIVCEIAARFGWSPRRINPAVNYLVMFDLVLSSESMGTHPWSCHWIQKTHKTRRFVRDH